MSELPNGWESATLQDVASWASGGTPSRLNPAFYAGAIPWFKTGELGVRLLSKSEEHISEEAVSQSSAKVFPKGSVALAMYGATIGKTSIFSPPRPARNCCSASCLSATPAGKPSSLRSSPSKAGHRPRAGNRNMANRCSRTPQVCRCCRRGGCGRVLSNLGMCNLVDSDPRTK